MVCRNIKQNLEKTTAWLKFYDTIPKFTVTFLPCKLMRVTETYESEYGICMPFKGAMA